MIAILTIFGCFISAEAALAEIGKQPKGNNPLLYSVDDPILHLDADTFSDTVLRPNRTKACIVEFYKDWCGYCRHFAPFFKVLSKSIKSWPFVQVAAINCADAYNVKICKANDISTVPKLKYFPRSARSFEDGQVVEHSYDSAMEMREIVHQMIMNEFQAEMDKGNTDFYLNHMAYEQNGENNQREPWMDVSNSTQFLVQVFEQNIKEGLPFSLALLLFKPHVEGRRVLVTSGNDPRIVRPQDGGPVKLPYVTVMERGKTELILAESLNERTLPKLHELLKPMMEELNKTEQAEAHYTEPVHVVNCSQQPEKCKQMFFVGETDMLKAIHAALLDEVISSGGDEIDKERFPALRQFIELLIQRFPTFDRNPQIGAHPKGIALSSIGRPLLRSQRALKVFEHMKQFLDSKANEGHVSMDEWKAEFEQSKTQNGDPFPVTAEWEHCKGSRTIFRGFTCGLWTAFHAMTVQAYLGKEQNPLKTLKAIQGWVANFFSCSGCRRHFMEMTTKTFPMEASNVKKPEDVVLYLWKAHNIVNKRLYDDKQTEDPQFPKEQFPPTYLCPECQKSATGNAKEVELDPEKTLGFLLNYSTNIKARP
uniref:Sulfhydryl oxidase n=1 Tax=Globodera rostochiensis TaxID=31243 RepID=A0A914H3W3_GLORO